MEALTTIESRSSATRLTEPGPSRLQIEILLRAAARAPDHGRLAPWRFVVLQGNARATLADAMAVVTRERTPDVTPEVLERERLKAYRAPVVIAVAAAVQVHPKIPEIEQILAVGAAVENMMLAAHDMGLGAMWKTGAPAYSAHVKQALGFATSDAIVAFVYVGTVASRALVRPVDIESVTRWL